MKNSDLVTASDIGEWEQKRGREQMKKVVSGGPVRAMASPRPMTACRIQSR
jgi:hypothetical protein